MKTILINIVIFFSWNNCSVNQNNLSSQSQEKYKEHLSVVSQYIDFLEKGEIFNFDTTKLNKSAAFLEEITNIKCDIISSFNFDYEPSKENYENWKEWYKLNKKNLYLDGDKVKIHGNARLVNRNPVVYYKDKIRFVEKSINKQVLKDPDYSSAMFFLMELTKTQDIPFDKESKTYIPTEENLTFFKNWLKENKNKLHWNHKEMVVKLKEE